MGARNLLEVLALFEQCLEHDQQEVSWRERTVSSKSVSERSKEERSATAMRLTLDRAFVDLVDNDVLEKTESISVSGSSRRSRQTVMRSR